MYRILSHTADIGLELEAETLESLFREAAEGWRALVLEDSPVQGRQRRRLHLESTNLEDLLVQWLDELNYLLATEGWVPAAVRTIRLNQEAGRWQLNAILTGEPFDPERHYIYFDIKGVTYHQLNIVQKQGGYRTRVIFDI